MFFQKEIILKFLFNINIPLRDPREYILNPRIKKQIKREKDILDPRVFILKNNIFKSE